jgi:hypothetical protein
MDPDHYITSVNVVNVRDPVPLKGSFHFTPANGQVYLAFQARLDQGVSKVLATAECNVHGRSEATRSQAARADALRLRHPWAGAAVTRFSRLASGSL